MLHHSLLTSPALQPCTKVRLPSSGGITTASSARSKLRNKIYPGRLWTWRFCTHSSPRETTTSNLNTEGTLTSPFGQLREVPLPTTHATLSTTLGSAQTGSAVPSDTSAVTAEDHATTFGTVINTRHNRLNATRTDDKGATTTNSLPNSLPTPINALRLQTYLNGFPFTKRSTLIHGIRRGFSLQSSITSPPSPSSYENHQSALQHTEVVSMKLQNELILGRIAGPFTEPPLPGFITSPLGLVPKKSSSECPEFRLIHDLSFPRGNSVNSHIDPAFTRVQYEDLDHCISIINSLGPNCWISKADLKDAFRILPVRPADYRLLGMVWKQRFYYDKCLPMGCSISCQVFESLSQALQWILTTKLSVTHMSHILDDFIFFGTDYQSCKRHLHTFQTLATSLNIPIKHQKTVQPATTVILHGIEVDTINMTMRLPQDKLQDALAKVTELSSRKKAFLRRLFDLTKQVHHKSNYVRLNQEARLDLQAWAAFLTSFNGRVICLPDSWISSFSLKLYTDASAASYAAVFGSQWIQGDFPSTWQNVNIAVKELVPIVLAVHLWGDSLKNKKITLETIR